MSDQYDYLSVKQEDKKVLSNLAEMGARLKELRVAMLKAEEEMKRAKDEYEHYANVIIPAEMLSCGVDSISLADGGKLAVVHNYYCQPNKNPGDLKIMSDWLSKYAGEHLVKHDATVSAADMDKLKEQDIPFIENNSINTNSLKAFLKRGLGVNGGTAMFSIDDIPACMHFQEVTTVELEV